jgi:hypothetical protein
MKRFLSVVKWVPAIVCGLLVVAWVVSLEFQIWALIGLAGPPPRWAYLEISRGRLTSKVSVGEHSESNWGALRFGSIQVKQDMDRILRRIDIGSQTLDDGLIWGGVSNGMNPFTEIWFRLPVFLVLTVLLPPSLAPFTRFRFPLWSYFAWTALVAAELFYLR